MGSTGARGVSYASHRPEPEHVRMHEHAGERAGLGRLSWLGKP